MKKEVIAFKSPKSPISEIFKTLRTNIQFMNVNKKMQVLLLTSTFPGEGKSWVTSNLAVTFAQAGKRVIVIDSDMRKGRQYAIFGVSPTPGLSNFLSEVDCTNGANISNKLGYYIQETEVDNLHIMTSGNVPPNPSELLVSGQMLALLQELRNAYDIVMIDGTPCELVTDSVILSRIADSTIIVTAHKKTKKDALERVVKSIKNVGGKIAGVVINKVPVSAKRYGERYYYYGEENKMVPKKKGKNIDKEITKQEAKIKDMFSQNNKFRKEKRNDMKKLDEVKIIENKLKENEMGTSNYVENFTNKEISTQNQPNNFSENQHNLEPQSEISTDEKNDILKQINNFLDNENNN